MSFYPIFQILLVQQAHAKWSPLTVHNDRISANARRVREALEVDGVLIIEHVPRLVESSTQAFESLTNCNALTAASRNSKGVFEEFVVRSRFDSEDHTRNALCEETVSLEFRSLLHQAGVNVAQALGEKALAFVQDGHHKEQFRRYVSSKSSLPIHTDAGFFLAMTSRWEDPTILNQIEIEAPDGDFVLVTIPPHAVVILGGEGFGVAHDVLGVNIRAVPHAPVVHDLNSSRFWYGEMFLPHDDFPIALNLKMKDWLKSERPQDVGCLPANYPHGSVLRDLRETEAICDATNEMVCWMTCIDMREYNCMNSTDPKGGLCASHKSHHNRDCKAEVRPDFKKEPFCIPGSGTDMFMGGFQAVFGGGPQEECLVFFFKGASLDAVWKFVLALFGIMALGIVAEGILKLRRNLAKRGFGRVVKMSLYMCNVTLGYLVMLATMTYSYEYFFAAILGLTIGHYLFNVDDKASPLATTACCRNEIKDSEETADDEDEICCKFVVTPDTPLKRFVNSSSAAARESHTVSEVASNRRSLESARQGIMCDKLEPESEYTTQSTNAPGRKCHASCQGMEII
eukprot:GEMP01011295.1.p1 GENE.GEMP01011295.1~~GEMP01011295.1.p1  ORF type:complete len:570 (+),score=112.74 GEMP01011295.1:78-1787(+)